MIDQGASKEKCDEQFPSISLGQNSDVAGLEITENLIMQRRDNIKASQEIMRNEIAV